MQTINDVSQPHPPLCGLIVIKPLNLHQIFPIPQPHEYIRLSKNFVYQLAFKQMHLWNVIVVF